ncbi:hypothetical protein Cgig2_012382 [Carnegiea gigantea]|uniref:Protein ACCUMULATION AND REPLICATION OF CHLOROPLASTS 3 n=1 Tax=Carnegiea gigantea TaxID=171969 RepID=A0A9Q1JKD1_9CARY|nr:hypothetical protein Cgig2_012382 [Carnegiea gigantea]
MDLVTLDEALKTAYRAVSSAINAVSILVSDNHKKHIHSLHGGVRQIIVTEVIKVLESYKEGKVGFGFGHTVEASIMQAVYDCPFLSMGLKDLDGIVICILSSSSALEDNDVRALLHTFRQATECTKDIILSVVYDPDMKPNLIATTVITVCVAEKKSSQKTSLLSRLVDSIPVVFNFLQRNHMQSDSPKGSSLRENVFPAMLANFIGMNEVPNMVPVEGTDENIGIFSGKELLLDENSDEKVCGDDNTFGFDWFDANGDSSKYIQKNVEGSQASERELLINRNFGPGYRIDQDSAEEDVNSSAGVSVADNPKTFILPVGVRLADDLHETFDRSNSRQPVERLTPEDAQVQAAIASVSPLNGVTNAGFDVVAEFWNGATTLLRGRQLDITKKQGVLLARAASMLEAERDAKTRWSPVVEIRYRGGIYKGRCQGGLPERRGRLTFQDGSVYDGMWRYGKRSGIGSLFFSNGDVFHGSWRDDLMHGKETIKLPKLPENNVSSWYNYQNLTRAGFTSIAETDGLPTFGRAEPMVKGDSILSLERSSLANSKMGGDMATFFVSKLMVQGVSSTNMSLTVTNPTSPAKIMLLAIFEMSNVDFDAQAVFQHAVVSLMCNCNGLAF